MGKKATSNPEAKKARALWDNDNPIWTNTFCDLCVEQIDAGHRTKVLGLLISCLILIWVRVAQMALLGKNACVGQMSYTNSSNRQLLSLVALIVRLESTDYYTLVSEHCLYTSRISCVKSLHDLFVVFLHFSDGLSRPACMFICFCLAGATPKGILKTMSIPGLNIYHVKSNLQKYRISKFIPESSSRGKFERRNISELLPNFSTTCAAQLNEALQMQKEVHKGMSDQLEVQMRLKLKLEAQGRFLDQITEEHRNQATNTKPRKPISPISLPSLCEESESNAKELESDSEADRNEVQSEEGFRAPKRLRVGEDVFSPSFRNASVNLESYSQAMFLQKEMQISYPDHGLSFPWSIAACPSPLVPSFF